MTKTIDKKNERYLLYLDILGFSELIKKRKPAEIFSVIDQTLKFFDLIESEVEKSFRTIYFSDSFILYSEPGIDGDIFELTYEIGRMVQSTLLARGIPTRGSITYGEFEVQLDSREKHQVYFGEALIEAYRGEQKEKWIGITILKPAWSPIAKVIENYINNYEVDGIWKLRHDDVLLLNPFTSIIKRYHSDPKGKIFKDYQDANDMSFERDIQAFRILHLGSEEFCKRGDFTGDVAIKYHITITFLRDILGDKVYNWAIEKKDELFALPEFFSSI